MIANDGLIPFLKRQSTVYELVGGAKAPRVWFGRLPPRPEYDSVVVVPAGSFTGVTLDDQFHAVRRCRLTLSGFSISVAAADDFGDTKLLDLPDSNIHLLGLEANVTMVKGGVTNGLEAAVDLDVGIGTAVASAQTLATTMIDVLEKQDLDDNALSVSLAVHTQGQSTATMPKQIADGASSALYLNVGVPAGITADDALTCSGTIDLFYIDLGNVTS